MVLLLLSCDSKAVFDEYQDVPNVWHKKEVKTFKVNLADTISKYNLFVNVRNTNEYEFNNLYLIVGMKFPHGKVVKDTLQYKMAYPTGELMGEGFSSIKTNKLWYKEGVRFNELGDYMLSIEQAMRKNGEIDGVDNLKGVSSIGFRIEKTEKNK